MPTITNSIDIKAAPGEVWKVLGDLPATRDWLPGVVAVSIDGDVRICRMADGQEIHERISEVSDQQRGYRFEHIRVALPVRRSDGVFTVAEGPDRDTATVTLRTTFEPLDPAGASQLAATMRGAFEQSLRSLRRFVEDGLTWDHD